MLHKKPNYYQQFKCTADKCEATCCAGWQIVIDEASLTRYQQEAGSYGATLKRRIDWEEGVFKQDACKRCAFLKEDNLCDMFEQLGEESLCVTCTNYPRHIEEFENQREITLAISCPEVARIILSQRSPVTFYEEEVEGEEEEFEDFDPFFFSYLEDARSIMLKLLQNRDLSISVRMALVYRMAEELQEVFENEELFYLADVLEKYENKVFLANGVTKVKQEIGAFHQDASEQLYYSKAVFGRLYELEHLSDDWEPYVEQCWKRLYDGKASGYQQSHEAFYKAHKSMRPGMELCVSSVDPNSTEYDLDIIFEQLLVYFIFTYFCGAVYDGNMIGKVRLSMDSVFILYEMIVAMWIEQEQKLTRQDIERIVYRYSRELEHSDENLELMESVE